MNLVLTRYLYAPEVTLGRLETEGLLLYTLEEPWILSPHGPGGTPGKSCVPDGSYTLYPHNGDRFKSVWCLVNNALGVYRHDFDIPFSQNWGRAAVLIHSGNTTKDIEGCILVGLRYGQLDGLAAVLDSRIALGQLRTKLGAGPHNLEIKPEEGLAGT